MTDTTVTGCPAINRPTICRPTMRICVQIVTFNHQDTIEASIRSVFGLRIEPHLVELRIFDNASADSTAETLRKVITDSAITTHFEKGERNLGFCAAQNLLLEQAISAGADFILLLNPDLVLDRDAALEMVNALLDDPTAAAATPRLYRANANLEPSHPLTFDAAGMYITPEIRHLDRGSGEIDCGQYRKAEYVFGGTGAALLLRKEAIIDLQQCAIDGKLLNEMFFAYREDAELAWRIQRLGWNIRYVPSAIGYHIRRVLPENRSELPIEINRLGVQNRFLLQLLHLRLSHPLNVLIRTTFRNVIVMLAVLLKERSSLSAFDELKKNWSKITTSRQKMNRLARVDTVFESRWFSTTPYVEPAPIRRSRATKIDSIVAIVINYRAEEELVECITSLLRASRELEKKLDLSIIVVDNSEDHSGRKIAENFVDEQRLYWKFPERNLGFSGGINRALQHVNSDAVLILNPDVQLSADAIERLTDTLNNYENVGLVGPVLEQSEGEVQYGFFARRFPTLGSTLAELFFLHRIWPNNPWTKRAGYHDDKRLLSVASKTGFQSCLDQAKIYSVDQPAGACMMCRTSDLLSWGGMDESYYPAWFEDVDLNRRIRDAGQISVIRLDARVLHRGGYSKVLIGNNTFREIFTSNMFRYWKHYGTHFELALIKFGVRATAAVRRLIS